MSPELVYKAIKKDRFVIMKVISKSDTYAMLTIVDHEGNLVFSTTTKGKNALNNLRLEMLQVAVLYERQDIVTIVDPIVG